MMEDPHEARCRRLRRPPRQGLSGIIPVGTVLDSWTAFV